MQYNCLTNQAFVSYTVNGSVGPYTYTLVNTANNATVFTGFSAINTGTTSAVQPGTYIFYFTDGNNCVTSALYTVLISYAFTNISVANTTSVTCSGGNNGSAIIIPPSSFSANPVYSWSPGNFNTAQVTTLSGGITYTVTVTDAKGCLATTTISVNAPPPIVSTLSNTFITCFGKSLNTVVSSTNNVGATNYTLNGIPLVANTANNILPGIQNIVTKDSKGCVMTNTVLVTQEIQTLINFNPIKPTCPGKSDGSLIPGVTNAPGAFSYTWLPGSSSLANLTNIPAGNYTLSVLDGNGCITTSVTALLPAASATVTAVTKPENCSAADGSFTLSVTGVNPPFTYTTLPIGPHAANTQYSLSSGSYTTLTKYNNNCIDTLRFNIGNLSTVSITVQSFVPVLCYNNCTASLSIGIQNAAFPVTYSATGTATTSSNILTNLCAGFYVITAVDANGCPATTTINLAAPAVFSYSASAPGTACSGQQVSLSGSATGGSGGYTYIWNPGAIVGQFVNLTPAGTTVYSLNVYDSNGCTQAPKQVTVTVRPQITVNINASNSGVCPGTTAQITPTISGGDGNYTYLWLPGNTTGASIYVANVTVPTYSFIVRDGCGSPQVTKLIHINLFPVVKPTFDVINNRGCEPLCTQFFNTTAKSTSASWNFGDQSIIMAGDTIAYCFQRAGNYDLRLSVVDSNFCRTSFTYSGAITVLARPKADFISEPLRISLKDAENVLIKNLTLNGDNYQWYVDGKNYSKAKDINYSFDDTGCYRFDLIAENLNFCADTAKKYICVVEDFNFYMPNSFTPNDNGVNDYFIPKGTGWVDKNYLFEIYDRWGRSIFKTNQITTGWDGSNSGELTPFDCFFWHIKITDTEGMAHELNGRVTVLR